MDRLERLLPEVSYFYTSMIIMGPHEGHNLEKRLRRYKRNFDRLGIAREVRKLIGIPTQVAPAIQAILWIFVRYLIRIMMVRLTIGTAVCR
jgi:hypothetical protein